MGKNLFKIAYNFLKNENLAGLYLAYDTGDMVVCFGGNPEDPYYGCRSVAVDKKTGNCEWFVESDEKNDRVLDESVEIDIPQEYAFTK